METEPQQTRRPRVVVLLGIACLGGLVALVCREAADALVARFPENARLIHVGMAVVFGILLAYVVGKPFFKEIGKPLR